jgi:NAD(P)-dependent dehydrogenase (short-subunit alcohol dehydrogenase family)
MTDDAGARSSPLSGRYALVIGGGSGIGFGSARLLARDGAAVTLAGRTEEKLAAAAAALAEEGVDVRWVRCDANEPGDVRAAVSAASDDERLHIAVVVPGRGTTTPLLMYDDAAFAADVLGNVGPVFLTVKYAGRAMVRAGDGSVVAISSTAASFSTRYLSGYAAGKAAVDQLVRVAADELGGAGVRVNSIRSGFTITPATERQSHNVLLMQEFLRQQPLARHGEIDDQARAVRFLAGPESSWITGQNLCVDGGHTLRAFPDYASFLSLPDQYADSTDGIPSSVTNDPGES